jgi:hypothetical protein
MTEVVNLVTGFVFDKNYICKKTALLPIIKMYFGFP